MKKTAICIVIMFLLAAAANAADIDKIVRKLDDLFRSTSSRADIEMEIVTPHWQRTLILKSWSLGSEKTFIRIYGPKKERGVGTLKLDEQMCKYLPRTNKVIKIPPSMMMSSWMGSDFKNDDLVREYTIADDYDYSLVRSGVPEQGLLKIKCVPREGRPIIWGHMIVVVDEKENLPVRYEYYDEGGKLMRLMSFSDVRVFSGRKIPSVMTLEPINKNGNRTVIRYTRLELDIPLDAEIFTLRNLRKGL